MLLDKQNICIEIYMEKLNYRENKSFIVEKLVYENAVNRTKVYLAKDIELRRSVIIKEIIFENDIQKKTILNEANNQIVLESFTEHIPFIYNVFVNDNNKKIAIEMSCIKGKNLREVISQIDYSQINSNLNKELFKTFMRIVGTMARVHRLRNFVHKDLKPENVILNSQRDAAYVIDFGISGPGLCKGIGTFSYMAPEQRDSVDRFNVSQATDVFSLALIGVELFTGRVPIFGDDFIYSPKENKWIKEPDIEKELNPLYSKLGTILKKAFALDPKDRYPNVIDMYTALKNIRAKK